MMLYRRNCIDISGRFTRTVRAVWLRLFLFGLLFSVSAVFACDVKKLELYIGDDKATAEGENTDTVYKKAGESFGWFVKWYWSSTSDEYNGDIYLEGVSEDTINETGSGWLDDSGTVTIPDNMETGENKTVKAKVGKGATPTEWMETEVTNLTVVSFEIVTPDEFPVYVAVNDSVALGCTFEPSTILTETYAWSKESGPGTVTFSPSSTSEDPSFSANIAGEYEVKSVCSIGGYSFEDTAGKFIVVLSGSLVLEDKHTGNSVADQADGGPPPPDTLYAGTDATDGYGDVKFWLVDPTPSVVYDWVITPGEDLEGTLIETTNPPYEDKCDDLEAGKKYTITVTTVSDPTYERKIEFIIPKLEITNDADEIITTTQTVSVGSEIHLKTTIEPSGLTPSDWVWTVPEIRVKDYVTTDLGDGRSKAEVIYLEETDLDDDNVTFYWVDGADGRSVSVSCKIEGVTCTDTVQFDVKSPTMQQSYIDTGTIKVGKISGKWNLMCGDLALGDEGFTYVVNVKKNVFDGQIKFVQIMQADLQKTFDNNSTKSWKVPDIGTAWWLDVSDPYQGVGPWSLPASGWCSKYMNDYPIIPLGLEENEKKMDNKFMDFSAHLMFKPTSTDAIWVPLEQINWGWKGIAETSDGGENWTKTSGAYDPNPPEVNTPPEFPEWDDTKTNDPEHPTWQAD